MVIGISDCVDFDGYFAPMKKYGVNMVIIVSTDERVEVRPGTDSCQAPCTPKQLSEFVFQFRNRGAESWWGCSDSGSDSGLLIDSESGSDSDSGSDTK